MSKNIKLGNDTLTGVDTLRVEDADTAGTYDVFVDTSDANAVAGNILNGKTAYVNGTKVTGNYQPVTPTGKLEITDLATHNVSEYAEAQVVDSDIIASNIRQGVNILGVNGTLVEGIVPTGKLSITDLQEKDVTTYAKAQVSANNLLSSNIKKNVNILGVVGTYEGTTPTGNQDITTLNEYDVSAKATARISATERAKIIPENIKKDITVLGVTGTHEGGGGQQPTLFAPVVTVGVNEVSWANDTRNGGFNPTITAVVDGQTVTSPLTITQAMDGKTLTITASATNFNDGVTTVTLQYTSVSPLTSQKDSSINEYQYALFTGGQAGYRLRFNDGTTGIGTVGTTLFIKQSNDVITSSNYLEITQTDEIRAGYVTKSNLTDNNFEINAPGTAFTPADAKRVDITLTNITTGTEYKAILTSSSGSSFGYLPAGLYSMVASIS